MTAKAKEEVKPFRPISIGELLTHPELQRHINSVVRPILFERSSVVIEKGMKLRAHPIDYLCDGKMLPLLNDVRAHVQPKEFDYSNMVNEFMKMMDKKSQLPSNQRKVIMELMQKTFQKLAEKIIRDENKAKDEVKPEKKKRVKKEVIKKDDEGAGF